MSKTSKKFFQKKVISLILLVVLVLSTGIMPSTVQRIVAGEEAFEEVEEAANGTAHTYEIVVSGDTATCQCTGDCAGDEGDGHTTSENGKKVTITASNQSYTGSAIAKASIAGVSVDAGFETLAGIATLDADAFNLYVAETGEPTGDPMSEVTAVGSYVATFVVDTGKVIKATFTVAKDDASVTAAPTANTLTYDGTAQALVVAGTSSTGTLQYKLGAEGTYSESIPTATAAGSYSVYYKVAGDTTHADKEYPTPINVTISKAEVSSDKKSDSKTILSGAESSSTYTLPALEANMTYGTPTASNAAITGLSISEGVLSYSGTASVATGTVYTITIPVTGTTGCNYNNYDFELTLTGTACAHTAITAVAEVPATCIADGVKAHNTCDTCHAKVNDSKELQTADDLKIVKLGHNYGFSASTSTLTAACLRTGCSESHSISISAANADYDGTAVTATITDAGNAYATNVKALPTINYAKKNSDDTYGAATTTAPTDAGTYKATITESSATAEVTFTISPMTLSSSNLTVSGSPFTYNGSEQEPTITVKATVSGAETTLAKDTDYTISGDAKGTNSGSYSFTVAGKGNFTGSLTGNWSISKATVAITTAPALANTTFTYNSSGISAITEGSGVTGGTLKYQIVAKDGTPAGESWTTTAPTTTAVGQYDAYYMVAAEANYTDIAATKLGSFEITKASVAVEKKSDSKTILAGYASTGSYTLPALEDNMTYGTPTASNAAIEGLSISAGILNYSGTASVVASTEYTITIPVTGTDGCNYSDYTFTLTLTGTACSHGTTTHVDAVAATCTVDGVKEHYLCTTCGSKVNAAKELQTADDLKIAKTGHSFNYTASADTLTARCGNPSCSTEYAITISATGKTYDGTAVAATITDAGDAYATNVKALPTINYAKKNTDNTYGTATTTAPTDAGTYKATITESSATAEVTFTIGQITLTSSNVTVSGSPFTYTGSTVVPTVVVKATVNGVETTLVNNTDYKVTGNDSAMAVGEYSFTITGEGNFKGTITENWSIIKAPATITTAPTLANSTFTYDPDGVTAITAGSGVTGGTLKYQIVAKDGTPASGSWTTTNPKATAVGQYDAYYMVAGDTDHSDIAATKIGSFEVTKASQSAPATPTTSEVKSTSVTITIPAAGKGETKYAYNTTSTAPTEDSAWQSSNKITGLTKDTGYYVFVKYCGNDNYEAAVSTGLSVTTLDSVAVTLTGVTKKTGIEDPGIKYDGSPITPAELYTGTPKIPDSALTAGELAYSYAGRNTTTHPASATAPTNPGDYTLTLTLEDADNVGTFEIDFVITKGTKAAPTGLTGVRPTEYGNSDGKITGLSATETYEYSTDDKATWTAVAAEATEITGLSAGTVYVRFKESTLYEASEAKAVTVSQGRKPSGPGSPANLKGVAPATKGGSTGKITGLDAAVVYEYSTNNGKTWKAVAEGSTEITGLKPGDVKVRVAATDAAEAGAISNITVPDKPSGTSGEVDKVSTVENGTGLNGAKLNNSVASLMNVKYNADTGKGIFTPEELAEIKAGAEANIALEITALATSSEAAEFEAKAEAALGEDVSTPVYMEINLIKTVNGVENNVTEPGTAIEVKVQLDESLILNDASSVRRYRILRLHNGELKVLTGTYNGATRELSFKTDGFSEYAIVYADTTVKFNSIVSAMDFDRFGDTYQLPVVVTPAKAKPDVVVFSSSDPSVATVDKYGTITAIKNGTTIITTKLNNELGTKRVTAVTVDVKTADTPVVVSAAYTVVKGDTLSKIASKNGMTLKALLVLNPQIKNVNKIYPGQQINVKKDSPAATSVTQATTTTTKDGKKLTEYVVKKNDTLSKIAKTYKMALEEVASLNSWIKNLHWIYPGQKIKVYNQAK